MTSARTAAVDVIKTLRANGHEAFLAGGCVRDMLMGRTANDYDVATSAPPNEVMRLFRRTLKVGARFGVVIVLDGKHQVEVATFRTESGYADGRHPSNVEFSSPRKDARRRDFTVNGMFYDPVGAKVIDFVNGQRDLRARIIRTIGSPDKRFGEDYLRMLRAVRFATQLDFTIETRTWAAIMRLAPRITAVSAERIAIELEATLTSRNRARGAMLLAESGLAAAIFPGFSGHTAATGIERIGLLKGDVSFAMALATLFSESAMPKAMEYCAQLKLSSSRSKHIKWLLERRGVLLDADMSVSSLKMLAANPFFPDLLELQRAIQVYHGLPVTPLNRIKKRVAEFDQTNLLPPPLIDGHELISLGAVPGPQVGRLARELYIAQLEGAFTDVEGARLWASKWLAEQKLAE